MYRSTDGTQRYSCKHAETDPTVAEVSIRARIRGISCTCILSYNRASCTTPLGGDSVRRRRWEDREEKGEKRKERGQRETGETRRGRGRRLGEGGGEAREEMPT